MTEDTRLALLGKLISDKNLEKKLSIRRRNYVLEDIALDAELKEQYETRGWVVQRTLKNSYRMKGPKPHDILFEDKVWCVFAQLGFTFLNSDREFNLPYVKNNPSQTKQIDVFARDSIGPKS